MAFGYFPLKQKRRILSHPLAELRRWVLGQDNLLKRAHVRDTFRHLNLNSHDELLEIGAGGLYYAGEIARRVRRTVALDYTDAVGHPLRTFQFPDGLKIIRGDAQALPFASSTFDKVFISEVFSVLPDARACVKEVLRVLKPGGRVVTVHGDMFRTMEQVYEWPVAKWLLAKANSRWGTPTTYADFERQYCALHGTRAEFFQHRDRFVIDLLTEAGFRNLELTWTIYRRAQLFYCFLMVLRMYRTGRPVLGEGQAIFLWPLKLLDHPDRTRPGGLTLLCSATKP